METPEDLDARHVQQPDGRWVIREFGKGECLVFQYDAPIVDYLEGGDSPIFVIRDTDATFLIDKITELERRAGQSRTGKIVAIGEPSHTEWNLEHARLRFQRWFREHDHPLLKYDESRAETARRALQSREDEPSDEELIERFTGDLESHRTYVRRRALGPVLILKTVPKHLWGLTYEANEAFCRGLFRASIAVCRAMLEDVVKCVARAGAVITRDFRIALDVVPETVLSAKERERALQIYERGSLALHEVKLDRGEEEARETLMDTATLIEAMINRGGLVRR